MPLKRARRAAAPDPGPPADPAPPPRPPVTAAELRDARLRLLRAQAGAGEVLARVLAECPALPGITGRTALAALDPERGELARELLARLGYDGPAPAGTA